MLQTSQFLTFDNLIIKIEFESRRKRQISFLIKYVMLMHC